MKMCRFRASRAALALTVGATSAVAALGCWQPWRVGFSGHQVLFADIKSYHSWSVAMASGLGPYRDFPVEYSPLALTFL